MSDFEWDSGEPVVLAEVDHGKETRFNDAKCDASGRLWCGKFNERREEDREQNLVRAEDSGPTPERDDPKSEYL